MQGGRGNYANLISASWRGGVEEAIHVTLVRSGCGQEESGNIMRVELATGSVPEQNLSNCPHQSKIKGVKKTQETLMLVGVAYGSCAVFY